MGTLATIVEPGASDLFKWASRLDSIIVFDPNVRRSVLNERNVYRAYFEKWAKIPDVVKLSDEDLSWLSFSFDEILDFGVDLVVVSLVPNCAEELCPHTHKVPSVLIAET